MTTAGQTPTATEQMFLALLNAARANPRAYGASVGLDLSTVALSPPLAVDLRLVAAARNHAWDMAARRYFAHVTPDGITPAKQIEAAGYPWQAYGQSIAAGSVYGDPAAALKALILDVGVPGAGHRRHLLGIGRPFAECDAVGVGLYSLAGSPYTHYWTIDTGRSASPRPWFDDATAKVRGWYIKYLGREPDAAGLGGLVRYLLSGASDVDALAVVLGSVEYYARAQRRFQPGPADARFLDVLYIDTLGRGCDTGGFLFWGPQVAAGQRGAVVRAVLASAEFKARG